MTFVNTSRFEKLGLCASSETWSDKAESIEVNDHVALDQQRARCRTAGAAFNKKSLRRNTKGHLPHRLHKVCESLGMECTPVLPLQICLGAVGDICAVGPQGNVKHVIVVCFYLFSKPEENTAKRLCSLSFCAS